MNIPSAHSLRVFRRGGCKSTSLALKSARTERLFTALNFPQGDGVQNGVEYSAISPELVEYSEQFHELNIPHENGLQDLTLNIPSESQA